MRICRRHTASGGEGLYTSLPSTPVWPCGHGVVHVIFSPDVSGGRRSFPLLVLRQLTCLACDVAKVFRIGIKTHPDGSSGTAEEAVADKGRAWCGVIIRLTSRAAVLDSPVRWPLRRVLEQLTGSARDRDSHVGFRVRHAPMDCKSFMVILRPTSRAAVAPSPPRWPPQRVLEQLSIPTHSPSYADEHLQRGIKDCFGRTAGMVDGGMPDELKRIKNTWRI